MITADVGRAADGTNNVILLPVAFHSHESRELVQVIGPPQTVVPVAVPRNCTLASLLSRPLQIDFTAGVELPNELALAVEAGTSPSSEFRLRLVVATKGSHRPPSTSQIPHTFHSPSNTDDSPSAVTAEQEEPLDLSLHELRKESRRPVEVSSSGSGAGDSRQDSPPTSSSRKRLHCECGLSFIAEETLRGHQSYYCRRRISNDGGKETPSNASHLSVIRSTPPKRKLSLIMCAMCEYQATSRLQISRHERLAHTNSASTTQGLVCPLCGYRGYSLRGVRIHLRVAHAGLIQPICEPVGLNAKLLETLLLQANKI